MKKSILLMAIIAIGILSCYTTNAMETIGTVDYKDYIQVDIIAPHEVDLEFLFSTMNESDVSIEKILYIPSANKTKYLITSNIVEPKWWMNFSDVSYYYLDSTTEELYELKVNYDELEVPDNPWKFQLDNITERYGSLSEEYNQTMADLEETMDELILKKAQLMDLKEDHDTLIIDYKKVDKALNENYTKYNQTYNRLIEVGKNASKYGMFFEDMTDPFKNGFFFQGDYYLTKAGADNKIETLQNDLNAAPLWTILWVVIVIIICGIIILIMPKRKIYGDVEVDTKHGYTPEMNKLDKFCLRDRIKNVVPKSVRKKSKDADKYNALENKINQDVAVLHNKIDENHKDIVKKLEQALKAKAVKS